MIFHGLSAAAQLFCPYLRQMGRYILYITASYIKGFPFHNRIDIRNINNPQNNNFLYKLNLRMPQNENVKVLSQWNSQFFSYLVENVNVLSTT